MMGLFSSTFAFTALFLLLLLLLPFFFQEVSPTQLSAKKIILFVRISFFFGVSDHRFSGNASLSGEKLAKKFGNHWANDGETCRCQKKKTYGEEY
jgi:hypothetical protein